MFSAFRRVYVNHYKGNRGERVLKRVIVKMPGWASYGGGLRLGGAFFVC